MHLPTAQLSLPIFTKTKPYPIPNPTEHPINSNTNAVSVVLETTQTKKELVRFLHATCFYPVKSIWIKVISNGNFATFPGLTKELVSKYLLLEVPTILGHLHKHKQGIRSTTARAANM